MLRILFSLPRVATDGSDLPAMRRVIERMELDFTQKFVMNFKHDIEKDVEIGKIQISFLDSVGSITHRLNNQGENGHFRPARYFLRWAIGNFSIA